MKKRPLLSTAMRISSVQDGTRQPAPPADAMVDPALTSFPMRPDPTKDQVSIQVTRQPQIDTLPAIYADAMMAATHVASQAWRQSFDFQIRLSTYVLDINRRALSGRSVEDRTGD